MRTCVICLMMLAMFAATANAERTMVIAIEEGVAGSDGWGMWEGSVTGKLFGLPDDIYPEYSDTVTVEPNHGDTNDMWVYMTYMGGATGDMRCDIVIDQSVAKGVVSVRIRNLDTETTNQNVLSLSMWVAPASGLGSESDPSFDPNDKASYSVQIFPQTGGGEGILEPPFNSAGVERGADVTDVRRRYILMSIKSNFWGDLGTMSSVPHYNYVCMGSDISVLGGPRIIETCAEVIDFGLTLTEDLYKDCYVNSLDVGKLSEEWLGCTVPGQAGCVQLSGGTPTYYIEPVPVGGITVDGDLGEWPADSEWVLLDKIYDGSLPYPSDIVGYARCSMRWDDSDNKIYVAVIVEDTDQIFGDPNGSYSNSDRIEIYSQGDAAGGTGWGAGGTEFFDVAQQYMVGPNTASHWAFWADFNDADPAALVSAVTVTGDVIVYELAVTQYDNYGGISGVTAITDLGVGWIVGFDIVVGAISGVSGYDMLAENTFTGKSLDAGQFQEYELANSLPQQHCGDWGYLDSDIVPDCYVNLKDFATIAIEWLKCNDPENEVDCSPFNW